MLYFLLDIDNAESCVDDDDEDGSEIDFREISEEEKKEVSEQIDLNLNRLAERGMSLDDLKKYANQKAEEAYRRFNFRFVVSVRT